jgi:tetratricopeptide (TPR) repeat protein
MRSRPGIALALVLGSLLAVACVSALREPPTLEQLAERVGRGSAGEVPRLLADAEQAYARRTLKSVRRAADLWLRAAVADAGRTEGWIGATRSLVWVADHLPTREERRAFAESAVHTAQWCRRAAEDSAACRFWLAVALGLQARERRSTGLDAMPKMVELLLAADRSEPELEEAGPSRVLALLYLRAPGWPTGPGDPDLGLEYAERAVTLRPDYPPNLLALAEALAAVDESRRSREAYEQALALAEPQASSGVPDAGEWAAEAARALGKAERD